MVVRKKYITVVIAGKWLFYNDNLGHFGKINRIQLDEEPTLTQFTGEID